MALKCEAKVTKKEIKFKDNNTGIDEYPKKWPDGEISYRLNNYTKDIKKQALQDRAVTVALRAWQLRVGDLKFRRERNKDTSVDFDVAFQPLEKFRSAGVLAHAWYPGQGKISGDCEINDEWNWVTSSKFEGMNKPPLVPVLIHEFGHSLGLKHDTISKLSIMYPSFSLGSKKNKLHQRDIDRIQAKYGVRTVSQRLIDYFQKRRDMAWDFD